MKVLTLILVNQSISEQLILQKGLHFLIFNFREFSKIHLNGMKICSRQTFKPELRAYSYNIIIGSGYVISSYVKSEFFLLLVFDIKSNRRCFILLNNNNLLIINNDLNNNFID